MYLYKMVSYCYLLQTIMHFQKEMIAAENRKIFKIIVTRLQGWAVKSRSLRGAAGAAHHHRHSNIPLLLQNKHPLLLHFLNLPPFLHLLFFLHLNHLSVAPQPQKENQNLKCFLEKMGEKKTLNLNS